jgi:hypothetical protein
MTNATVDALVERVEGPILTLKHKDGSVTVSSPRCRADSRAPRLQRARQCPSTQT